jgi:uncharacterized Fe-S cluster-containing radical SAM superfamily protein
MQNILNSTMQISIKPCTHKTFAQAYGISSKVLHRHLKQLQTQIGKRTGHFYTLMQLLIIIEKIGIPSAWLESLPTNKESSLA